MTMFVRSLHSVHKINTLWEDRVRPYVWVPKLLKEFRLNFVFVEEGVHIQKENRT